MLGQRLKQLRADRSINQIQLAQELGVNQGTVGKWETDSRKPDVETLGRLAEYFDVTIDYLLGRDKQDSVIAVLTRKLNTIPEEDRPFILDTLNSTLDIYYKSKGN
jgi:transcriptional regulator with XRE-family HTH domain